jgi:HEAT repeat protein
VIIKLISALGMGGFMLVSLFMAARIRYRKSKPAEKQEPADTSVPLAEGLHHPDWKIRLQALHTLEASPDALSSLPDVILMLNDADTDVREAAARVVALFGSAAVEGLAEILSSGNLDARTLVAKLLADIGDTSAVPALITALHDHSVWVRLPAVEALGKIGDNSAVEALASALANDHQAEVRTAAREALQNIGTPEALAALKNSASS